MKDSQKEQNLGCGKRFKKRDGKIIEVKGDCDFICGVLNGWGQETFCFNCKLKMKKQWNKEDRTSKDSRIRKIYKLKKEGKLNY